MTAFNQTNFLSSLKKEYDMIPYIQSNKGAKVMVADAIKANHFDPEESLSFIYHSMNPSQKIAPAEWKKMVVNAVKYYSPVGFKMETMKKVLKTTKVTPEWIFSLFVCSWEKNVNLLKYELYLDTLGWQDVVENLVGMKEEEKPEVETVEDEVVTDDAVTTEAKTIEEEENTSSIKSEKVDPRCKPVTLYKDGVEKTWPSMKKCEEELGVAHGTVSQYFSGKMKSVKGWTNEKDAKKSTTETKHLKKKAVKQTELTRMAIKWRRFGNQSLKLQEQPVFVIHLSASV
ncbi:hypothetical protein [Sodaliphilus pleomorphus]|uniref:Uncharacterized protein n=1 Tax=Sodaliphilus pleomorphus TaxID=2606626 RepID=A0A6L5XGV8_9BACT|nr:hypothetical protein [Sodaliphilus pleomorphus]MSS18765.1 hypothetical protein [Sodaliphilus pleomorphus]